MSKFLSDLNVSEAAVRKRRSELYSALRSSSVLSLRPGVHELLHSLSQRRIPAHVSTHSTRTEVSRHMTLLPDLEKISHWVCREDCLLHKPNSECYEKSLHHFLERLPPPSRQMPTSPSNGLTFPGPIAGLSELLFFFPIRLLGSALASPVSSTSPAAPSNLRVVRCIGFEDTPNGLAALMGVDLAKLGRTFQAQGHPFLFNSAANPCALDSVRLVPVLCTTVNYPEIPEMLSLHPDAVWIQDLRACTF